MLRAPGSSGSQCLTQGSNAVDQSSLLSISIALWEYSQSKRRDATRIHAERSNSVTFVSVRVVCLLAQPAALKYAAVCRRFLLLLHARGRGGLSIPLEKLLRSFALRLIP